MDRFFSQKKCDRCYGELTNGRTMSWFNEDTICMECSKKEDEIKKKLTKQDKDTRQYEGCGYIPNVD